MGADNRQACADCNGVGMVTAWLVGEDGKQYPVNVPCPACGGSGLK